MTKMILKFKAKDFNTPNYCSPSECAITKALKRSGFPDMEDCGTEIIDSNLDRSERVIVNWDNQLYVNLVIKVLGMYSFATKRPYSSIFGVVEPIEAKDFEYTIEY